MDKATVVSLFPMAIDERKPGIYPGHFTIPAAKDDIEILHVGNSIYWVNFHDGRPSLQVNTPADEIAASIVNDFVRNIFGMNVENSAWPGLFWVEGHPTKDEIKKKYADKIAEAQGNQRRWFENLIRLADDAWVGSNKQHRAIADIQRHACRTLGLTRDWLIEIPSQAAMKTCPNCQENVNSQRVVCKCGFIFDETKYKAMKFAGA
jgi:hypothetical protein